MYCQQDVFDTGRGAAAERPRKCLDAQLSHGIAAKHRFYRQFGSNERTVTREVDSAEHRTMYDSYTCRNVTERRAEEPAQ